MSAYRTCRSCGTSNIRYPLTNICLTCLQITVDRCLDQAIRGALAIKDHVRETAGKFPWQRDA